MDCKKALQETEGEMEKAVDFLREKGMARAAKKADRVAAEGSRHIEKSGNNAVLIEVNCETDFVTKNEQFQELLQILGKHIVQAEPKTVDEALQQNIEGKDTTVEAFINSFVAKIGEKISLRRFTLLTKTDKDA